MARHHIANLVIICVVRHHFANLVIICVARHHIANLVIICVARHHIANLVIICVARHHIANLVIICVARYRGQFLFIVENSPRFTNISMSIRSSKQCQRQIMEVCHFWQKENPGFSKNGQLIKKTFSDHKLKNPFCLYRLYKKYFHALRVKLDGSGTPYDWISG